MSILSRFWKSRRRESPSEKSIAIARALRDEVVRHYQAANLEDALNTARQLLELQRQELGEAHPDFAIGLKNVEALQRLRDAEIEAREAVAAAPELTPDPVPSKSESPVNTPGFAILDRIRGLDYRGTGDHTCLSDAQRLAQRVRDDAELGNSPSNPLMEGFQSLLKMVENGQALGNEEWIAVHDAIVKKFGRPLARAAASGKLVIGNGNGNGNASDSSKIMSDSSGFHSDRTRNRS